MSDKKENKIEVMTEEEFAKELKGSLLVLSTSSPDKREIFREMFSSHDLDGEKKVGGIDVFFTDSGALGIPARKTPEKNNSYDGNLYEKEEQQLEELRSQESLIRSKLRGKDSGNQFDPKTVNIVGMTEDSGWELEFASKDIEKKFIDKIIEKIKPHIREKDYSYLIEKLHKTGFPGPNLKPIQEHLTGGFNQMMGIIYDTAEELKIDKLRFVSTSKVAFVFPRKDEKDNDKVFLKEFATHGEMIGRKDYEEKLLATRQGEAINSNFVHIPDGQKDGARLNVDELVKEGIYTTKSSELPASYARRELTEYLQDRIGKRESTEVERNRPVKIAIVSPHDLEHGFDLKIPYEEQEYILPDGYERVRIPTVQELRDNPNLKVFDGADVIVLVPEKFSREDNNLHDDPNLRMLQSIITTIETDPASMSIPLVLDNSSEGFDNALKQITDDFAQGRLKGESPFRLVRNDKESNKTLTLLKNIKQRAPLIDYSNGTHVLPEEPIETVSDLSNEGIPTVFIAGGHANNSKRDMDDAEKFGYFCAENGYRIVTGGGSIEGSMGAANTGFFQYHLDNLQDKRLLSEEDEILLRPYKNKQVGERIRYDAEAIILEKPELLNKLAKIDLIPDDVNSGLIPSKKFPTYSMEPLLKIENPNGKAPPATKYVESGNRVRRLDGLLSTGIKVFLPGSIGTDEELTEALKQRLDLLEDSKRIQRADAYPSGTQLSLLEDAERTQRKITDGTNGKDGEIIIFNRKRPSGGNGQSLGSGGHLNKLLTDYGLRSGSFSGNLRSKHNITLVEDSLDKLMDATKRAADRWVERVEDKKPNQPPSPTK